MWYSAKSNLLNSHNSSHNTLPTLMGCFIFSLQTLKEGIVFMLYRFGVCVKGQLISKCPFSVIVWTKIPTKIL